MANALKIMRGLPIPDSNFVFPTDSWTATRLASTDFSVVGPTPTASTTSDAGADPNGTGSSFAIKLDSAENTATAPGATTSTHITSGLTPYGVASGPIDTAADTLTFYVAVSAKTYNVGDTNARPILWAKLASYDEDGNALDATTLGGGGNAGRFDSLTDSAGWALFTTTLTATLSGNQAMRYWKLILYFVKPSTMAATAWLLLDFVGVGVPCDTSGLDALTSWYSATFAHSAAAEVIGGGGYRPIKRMADPAFRAQYGSIALPNLTGADKRIVQVASHWQRPGRLSPSTPGTVGPATTSLQLLIDNHGVPSPALVVLDRDDMKRAFYATWPEPEYQQITGAYANAPWWPDSGARWSTVLNFTEEIV